MAVDVLDLQQHRSFAFAIAYRMLGSVTEAEDVVQEAMLRIHRASADGEEIDDPRAYVATVVTRLAIDQLRSARVRRERYVGIWLPEPLLGGEDPDAGARSLAIESLSAAFLVVLERLSPVERAVFLLRDVFDLDYAQIAGIAGKSEDNVRQIAVRARRHVRDERSRFDDEPAKRRELAEAFLAALEEGDTDAMVRLLAADAAAYGDGGGKSAARRVPVQGAVEVARFLAGLWRLAARAAMRVERTEANGGPALLVRNADGTVASVMTFDAAGGAIRGVYAVVNPDKLAHISRAESGA